MSATPPPPPRRGDRVRMFYGAGNPNNCLLHVRAVVDGHFVMRWWSRVRRDWRYVVEHPVWWLVNSRAREEGAIARVLPRRGVRGAASRALEHARRQEMAKARK